MSEQTQDVTEMWTKPVPEHEWLQKLVGEWRVTTEMMMGPGQPKQTAESVESVKSVGGLWAFAQGKMTLPGGTTMENVSTLGYDVTSKEYRGCWFAAASSHLWEQTGDLSADGKTMTLNGVGPSMTKDGENAHYRDVIEIQDADHRTVTSYGQGDNGEWQEYMKSQYTRV